MAGKLPFGGQPGGNPIGSRQGGAPDAPSDTDTLEIGKVHKTRVEGGRGNAPRGERGAGNLRDDPAGTTTDHLTGQSPRGLESARGAGGLQAHAKGGAAQGTTESSPENFRNDLEEPPPPGAGNFAAAPKDTLTRKK